MPSKLQLPLGQSQSPLIPAAALLAAMVSLQVGASFAKELFPAVGAEGATVLRLGFAALLLMVVMWPWRVRFDAADWRWLVAYGLAIGGMNLLFYMAIATLPPGIGTALMFAGPLTAALLSSRRLADFLWVGLAVGGLLLLLPIFNGDAADDPRGLALALGAGGCWVLYIFAGKRAGEQHGPQAAALGMAIAACAVLPIGGSAEWSALSAGFASDCAIGRDPVQRGSIHARNGGAQAAADGNLQHHDQHGARSRCAGGSSCSGRAAIRYAMARSQRDHNSIDRYNNDGQAGGGVTSRLSSALALRLATSATRRPPT